MLVCVGRVPNTEGLNLEKVGINVDKRGFVEVDDNLRTNKPHIYAIGDIVRGPMLAHKAEEEGVMAAELIKTGHGHVNYNVIPGVVYTEPEIAMVGKTEAQLKAENVEYTKGVFPLQGNSRARAYDSPDGLIKVLADKKTKKILGVHMCGLHVSEMIAEAGLAMEFGSTAEDVARTCHAHPVRNHRNTLIYRLFLRLSRRLAWLLMTRLFISKHLIPLSCLLKDMIHDKFKG